MDEILNSIKNYFDFIKKSPTDKNEFITSYLSKKQKIHSNLNEFIMKINQDENMSNTIFISSLILSDYVATKLYFKGIQFKKYLTNYFEDFKYLCEILNSIKSKLTDKIFIDDQNFFGDFYQYHLQNSNDKLLKNSYNFLKFDPNLKRWLSIFQIKNKNDLSWNLTQIIYQTKILDFDYYFQNNQTIGFYETKKYVSNEDELMNYIFKTQKSKFMKENRKLILEELKNKDISEIIIKYPVYIIFDFIPIKNMFSGINLNPTQTKFYILKIIQYYKNYQSNGNQIVDEIIESYKNQNIVNFMFKINQLRDYFSKFDDFNIALRYHLSIVFHKMLEFNTENFKDYFDYILKFTNINMINLESGETPLSKCIMSQNINYSNYIRINENFDPNQKNF